MITPYMDLNKARLVLNAFFMSQLNYCQLVWMCHNRTKNKVNSFMKDAFDEKSSFEELLDITSSASIHDRNLRNISWHFTDCHEWIFTIRHQNQYNIINWTYSDVPKVRTVNHGSESVRYLSPKIWEIIPTHAKELDNINKFKVAIKNWKLESCPCRPCKVYLQNIGCI